MTPGMKELPDFMGLFNELIRSPYLLISLLSLLIYVYFTRTFDFWSSRSVSCRKPTVFFGNYASVLLFRKSISECIQEMYSWFPEERFFGVYKVRSPVLVLRDPELVKAVCSKDFFVFSNRGIPVNNSQDPLAGHLFNLEGKRWKGLRSKLTPAFSSGKIKRMFYLLAECSEEFQGLIRSSSGSVEVRDLAAKFTIDVIGSCAFGIQIGALANEDSEFRRMARKLSSPGYKATLWRTLRTALPGLYKLLGVQVIDPEVTRFFKDVVSQMIHQRTNTEVKRHDFMDLLIELKNKGSLEGDATNGAALNDEDAQAAKEIELDENAMAAQAFVFFTAGYETSSTTISFCLYELALDAEVQDRTRQDILSALEKTEGKLTYDAVQEMKYLDMVVLETLRKYPPGPLLSRRCEQPYKIPGTKVELPTGMRVVIPIYGLHHDPDHYPEPERFVPERFSEENRRSRHPYTFLAFGEGPRSCIGMRFALLQTKVGIISFLRGHRVEICDKSPIPMKFSSRSLVTTSEKGFWLSVIPLP
ncbi:probable cytochrome P450 6a13 [Orussus abietinus]|uniref:probable cytochrome P450 6a13 n=1 Tax=Orussus abietinus TaxID=222816 RepID=UPI000625633D|nr:probable cytochrome P450 6a13 [Orussus abietinus]XP_012280031.1 probable cytochrome P450 6a13 [Orussus abietinus]XP_012280032.1 probable cytochrome P450 6a13 [Orussus abietinus]XP_023289920.1 probable cytochrome P450 6a13 [Orussus abietinus]